MNWQINEVNTQTDQGQAEPISIKKGEKKTKTGKNKQRHMRQDFDQNKSGNNFTEI